MARTNNAEAPKVVVIITTGDDVTHYIHPDQKEIIEKYLV